MTILRVVQALLLGPSLLLLSESSAHARSRVILGVGSFMPDTYVISTPDGKGPGNHLTGSGQLDIPLKYRSVVISPRIFLTLLAQESADQSFKTRWTGLSLPVSYEVLKLSQSRLHLVGGLARLSCRIEGSGGIGGMDGTELRPAAAVETKNLYLHLGASFHWRKYRVAAESYVHRFASSKKRSLHLMMSFQYEVF